MPQFTVYRHGFNDANQPASAGCERVLIGTVEADDAAHAKRLAHAHTSCYHNQWFEAQDADEARREADRLIDQEARWNQPNTPDAADERTLHQYAVNLTAVVEVWAEDEGGAGDIALDMLQTGEPCTLQNAIAEASASGATDTGRAYRLTRLR